MEKDKEAVSGLDRELSFTVDEYKYRVREVQEAMKGKGVEVLLAHHPLNVLYLSGFQSINMYDSECVIIPQEGDITLLVPEREMGNALLQSWVEDVHPFSRTEYPDITFRQPMQALTGLLRGRHLDRGCIGIERRSAAISAQKYETLKAFLDEAELVDGSGIVESVRACKSQEEIAYLRRAASLTNQAMNAAITAAGEGKTDNDVAAAAYQAMYAAGGEYVSLPVIVNSGRRSGIIHSTHKRVRLNKGDGVCIELGACFQRYTSPCMRTLSIGEPNEGVSRLANACLTALNNVLATMGPGVIADEVAKAGMEGIAIAGSNVIFHGCFGYSVGGAFPPSWADGTVSIFEGMKFQLRPGMVFHIPMGLRVIGEYGAMFSETALITDDGCEALTNVDRHLFIR